MQQKQHPEAAQWPQLTAYVNTSQDANTSLTIEVCHYCTSKTEYSVCMQGAKWFCQWKEMERKCISESKIKFYSNSQVWALGRHSDLRIRAQTHIFWLKVGSCKNEKHTSQILFQVTGWKYLNFCAPRKAECALGWCPQCPKQEQVPVTGKCSSQLGHRAAGFLWWGLACGKGEGEVLALLYLKWLSAPCENSLWLNLCW